MKNSTKILLALALIGCGPDPHDPVPSAPPNGAAPAAVLSTPGGTPVGLVPVDYTLSDPEGSASSLIVEFSTDGGANWVAATPGPGGDGVAGLPASAGGTPLTYMWNSVADGVNGSVRLRFTPTDGTAGTPVETPDFTVSNTGISHGDAVPGFPILSNPTPYGDHANCIAVDGRWMYVFGHAAYGGGFYDGRWRVEKRSLVDGSLDPSFGSAGAIESNPSAYMDDVESIIVDSTHMYLAGFIGTAMYNEKQWYLEKRSLVTGDLDLSFGTGGAIQTGLVGDCGPLTLARDGDHLYIVGAEFFASPEDYRLRIEKRLASDGSLVAGFGTGGVVTSNVDAGADGAMAVVIVGSAMYVGGTDGGFADFQLRIEKRSLSDGSLDPSFGTGGVIQQNPAVGGEDVVTDLATDGAFLYVCAKTEPVSTQFDTLIQKRNLTDGALVASVTSSPSNSTDDDPRFDIDAGFLYLSMNSGAYPDVAWRVEKRLLSDLSLDAGFASGGVLDINPSTGDDKVDDIAVVNGVIYFVGEDHTFSDGQWRIEARFK